MPKLRYITAGESHGPAVLAVVEGFPAGVALDLAAIDRELSRRQGGYGRSARQKIEHDRVQVLSGLLRGVTIASPLTLLIANQDHRMDAAPPVYQPRPGHADLAGAMKYLLTDCRAVLERASARETAARVAAGAAARSLLSVFGIDCFGFVSRIGRIAMPAEALAAGVLPPASAELAAMRAARDASEVYCPDVAVSAAMIDEIRRAKEARDTVGGVVEVRVYGCPPGLGSCMSWQEKLDGRLMQAVGSIQAIKAVSIGAGFQAAETPGSSAHDAILYDPAAADGATMGFNRTSNRAGGLEGGMTNGMPIVISAAMKPISTLPGGVASVDLTTRQPARSAYERSDVCAVPAASVVAENVVAFEIAAAMVEKFGADTLLEMRTAYDTWRSALAYPARRPMPST